MIKRHKFKIDKLIIDKVSELMIEKNVKVVDHQMDQEEYLLRLNNKLVEEAKEVITAKNISELEEELADVLEVINAIASAKGVSLEDVENTRIKKKARKGGFERRIYCEYIEISSDNKEIEYCFAKPEEYPEIK